MPLFWRLFAVNAVILVLIAILLIASPVTISAHSSRRGCHRRSWFDRHTGGKLRPAASALPRSIGWQSGWRSSICSDPDNDCRPGGAWWGV